MAIIMNSASGGSAIAENMTAEGVYGVAISWGSPSVNSQMVGASGYDNNDDLTFVALTESASSKSHAFKDWSYSYASSQVTISSSKKCKFRCTAVGVGDAYSKSEIIEVNAGSSAVFDLTGLLVTQTIFSLIRIG